MKLKTALPALARVAPLVPQRAERGGGDAACARRARRGWRRSTATARTIRPTSPSSSPRVIRPKAAACSCSWATARPSRKDTAFRQLQSRIANGVRSGLLGDGTPDTGCGIKLFSRDVFMDLPRFDHMHRFLPALFQRHGARVISVPVSHRAAHARHVEVRNAQPPVGGHRRHLRRHVAAPALQVRPAGPRRLNL